MVYIEAETSGIGDDQILLGSSDIIESVFGRYKGFSGKTPMKEVGRAVLAIPVFTGKFDAAEVRTAMESVPAKDVDDWLRQNIGESFLSKRKRAFSLINTNFENSSVKLFPEILKKWQGFNIPGRTLLLSILRNETISIKIYFFRKLHRNDE
jgi:hypothetical protein